MTAMLIWLLIAHSVGDFLPQTDAMVSSKKQQGLRGPTLYRHAGIVAALSWLAIGDIRFWPYVLVLFVSHVAVDYLKTRTSRRLVPFIVDQLAHLAVLFLVARVATHNMGWTWWSLSPDVLGVKIPALLCAAIICTSPSNLFIREVLAAFRVNTTPRSKSHRSEGTHLRNPGALIGMLERLLILFFVLSNNFEAAGLTVAAKSLLRFRDDEGPRAEFVLVGTLLSFTIAVAIAALLMVVIFGKNIVG